MVRDRTIGLCEAESPLRVDPELFFANPNTPESEKAKDLCDRCPSQVKCMLYALREGITDGIWGGLSGEDRQRIWDQWPTGRPRDFDRTYHRQVGRLQRDRRTWEGMTA